MEKNKIYKKILVTGGAGFIGSHVVETLLVRGYEVCVMDSLESPTHDNTIPPWLNKNIEFIRGDVRSKDDWRKALKDIDVVIHLASYMDYHLDFSTYIRTNTESIALLFELIVEEKFSIKKIIAASSQSVYGEGKYMCIQHGVIYPPPRLSERLSLHDWEQYCPVCAKVLKPLPEIEDDLLKPQTPYGISKLMSEHLLMNLGRRHEVPVVALRYSIALGPRQSFRHFYSGALRSFAVDILHNDPIQMNEDGQQIKDFIHVQDVADAHVIVLEDSHADFEIFNVGSGQGTHIIDLAKIVSEECEVVFNPSLNNRYRIGDSRYSLMDVRKLTRLSWYPKRTLHDAVKDYLTWIRQFKDLKEVLRKTYVEMKEKGLLKQV